MFDILRWPFVKLIYSSNKMRNMRKNRKVETEIKQFYGFSKKKGDKTNVDQIAICSVLNQTNANEFNL